MGWGVSTPQLTADETTLTIASRVVSVKTNGVGATQLADNAVDTAAVQALAITSGKLAAGVGVPIWEAFGSGALGVSGATTFFKLDGSVSVGAETSVEAIVSKAFTLTDFNGRNTTAATGTATQDWTVRKNGADTAATLHWNAADAQNTLRTWAGSVSFAVGDRICLAGLLNVGTASSRMGFGYAGTVP